MPASAALTMLLDPDKNMLVNKVTIPEGMITVDIYARAGEGEQSAGGGLRRGRQGPGRPGRRRVVVHRQARASSRPGSSRWRASSSRPRTTFEPGLTAKQMLQEMVKQFNKVAEETEVRRPGRQQPAHLAVRGADRGVDRAGRGGQQRGLAKVAGSSTTGPTAATSRATACSWTATVNYWLRLQGKGGQGLRATSPPPRCTTRTTRTTPTTRPGLPPAPISNPGKDALQGAMNPPARATVLLHGRRQARARWPYASTKAQHDANVCAAPAGTAFLCADPSSGGGARSADRALPVAGDPQRRVRRRRPGRLAYDAHRVRRGRSGRVRGRAGHQLGRPVADHAAQGGRARRGRRGGSGGGAIGAANTLVRLPDGSWRAENTDAPGMVDALLAAGVATAERVGILGAGGTARAALAAARDLGADAVTVSPAARRRSRSCDPVAADLGAHAASAATGPSPRTPATPTWWSPPCPGAWPTRWPALAAGARAVLFDAVYDPWPTPLAAAAAAGLRVVSGLDLLLAQAVRQFELFTGVAAPVAAMREALHDAAAHR